MKKRYLIPEVTLHQRIRFETDCSNDHDINNEPNGDDENKNADADCD